MLVRIFTYLVCELSCVPYHPSLSQYLTKNPARRLGCQPGIGERQIKGHAFFRPIDWAALEDRKIKPPFTPRLVSKLGKGRWAEGGT